MSALYFLLIGLTLVVLFATVAPFLWNGKGRHMEDKAAVKACKEQLRTLENDRQGGRLDEAEAENARMEIQRRLLSLSPLKTTLPQRRWLPLFLIVVGLPVGSFALYFLLGSPAYPDFPYRERMIARSGLSAEESTRLSADIHNVSQALKDAPDNPALWRSLGDLNRYLTAFDLAADAYANALRYGDRQSDTLVSFGEMLVWSDPEGLVSAEAVNAFDLVLKRVPNDPRALYYTGLRAAQRDDPETALKTWERLLQSLPPDSPLKALVLEDIGRLHAFMGTDTMTGPAAAERLEQLVGALVAQLEEQPDHKEGWVALGRAYAVLGHNEKAREAFRRALELTVSGTSERRDIEELIDDLNGP